MEFEPLKDFKDLYEIGRDNPYPIRCKKYKYVVKEYVRKDRYISINLNQEAKLKQVIVAIQLIYIEDPVNKVEVHNCNHNRSDYHIENLIWATKSRNCRGKKSYNGFE